MWLPNNVIAEVEQVARITYVNLADTKSWNEHRGKDELRLLTGWAWTTRNGRQHRQGFKTMTVAYRDAYYTLIRHQEAPRAVIRRARLRLVKAA